jgi:signal transduction histidine kinase
MVVNIQYIVIMIIVLSIIIMTSFAVYRAFIQKIVIEKSRQHQLELEHQKEISTQYINVQENERKRIAEVLHDDVGNKLNILSLWINNEDTWNNERSKEIIAQQIPELNHKYQKRPVYFEVQIYRIIQEFLSNVIKHAHATEMIIHIRDTTNLLTIILSDNGVGFDTNIIKKGMGLKNIDSRIQSITAISKWKSKKGNGSQLIIALPKP